MMVYIMNHFEGKAKPLINQPSAAISIVRYPAGVAPEVNYESLWSLFKNSPEAIALLSAIVEDILSDGWYLEGGRNFKIKAEKFLEDNSMKALLTSFLFDVLITGDGYIYKVKNTIAEVKAMLDRISQRLPYEYKSHILDYKVDEDVFSTRKVIHVPSSTMTAKFNKHGDAKEYYQTVRKTMLATPDTATFSQEEIVHFRFMRLDGRFYGFSPFQSIINEMNILSNVKDYADYYFSQGGVPNFLFVLEDESPDSPNYKKFVERLQQFSNLQQKYKSMVVTGKVEPKELNKMTRDMEFKELAQYITQVMVMVWGVPASRLSELLITKGVKSGTSNTEGYYRKISHMQDLLEDLLNSQLLSEFKVKLRFNRTYKQDEIREVQIDQIKADTALKLLQSDMVNKEWVWRYMKIPENLRGKGKLPVQNQTARQGQLPVQKLMESSPDKLAQDADKQSIALEKR